MAAPPTAVHNGCATAAAQSLAAAARPGGDAWQLRLLGAVCARRGALEITHWPARAEVLLLARLALAPERVHPREELVELLWPGVALDVGRNRLRQALSALRHKLEPQGSPAVIAADRHSVRIIPEALSCDAVQFEALLRHGALAAARASYGGELLPGHYDEWVLQARGQMAERFERLDRELPTLPRANPLPASWTRLFGTERVVHHLQALVGSERLVCITGPGGSGKSRLAQEVARLLREHAERAALTGAPSTAPGPAPGRVVFNHVLFVPLVDCHDGAQALDALGRTLRLSAGDVLEGVHRTLDGQPVLLVLDNLEQMRTPARALVRTLLEQLPQLHLLLTSRQRLDIEGEQLLVLGGLPLPEAQAEWGEADDNPAVALFVDRAHGAQPEFQLGAAQWPAVRDLVRLLDGLPLALELAASRLRSLAVGELLQRLQAAEGSPWLDELARPGPALGRHDALRPVMAWSWQQLRPDEAALMQAMTVLGAYARAETVAAAAGVDDATAQRLLQTLVDASLVQVRQDARGLLRYGLLQPLREFAAQHLGTAAAAAARARVRRWLLQRGPALLDEGPVAFEAERGLVYAAILGAAADGAQEEAARIAVALRRHWLLDTLETFPAGVQQALLDGRATTDSTELASDLSQMLAQMRGQSGRMDEALALCDAALRQAGTDAQRAQALGCGVWLRLMAGRTTAADDQALAQALALAQRAGARPLQAAMLRLQAMLAINVHQDYARALPLAERAQALWEQLGDVRNARRRLLDRATCWAWMGREAEAAVALAGCEQASLQDADPVGAALSAWQLGRVLLRMGRAAEALAALQRGLRIGHRHHSPMQSAYCLLHIPDALVLLGEGERAARLFGFAVPFWEQRFGRINVIEARELRRTRRLLRRQLGAAHAETLRLDGLHLSRAAAVALALQPAAAAAAPVSAQEPSATRTPESARAPEPVLVSDAPSAPAPAHAAARAAAAGKGGTARRSAGGAGRAGDAGGAAVTPG